MKYKLQHFIGNRNVKVESTAEILATQVYVLLVSSTNTGHLG